MIETLTLGEFLLARITEDEAVAREVRVDDYSYDVAADRRFEAYGDHVEIGVARVLAECAAKRRIVEAHRLERHREWCEEDGAIYPCPTLRALASAYAGADGWREEWA